MTSRQDEPRRAPAENGSAGGTPSEPKKRQSVLPQLIFALILSAAVAVGTLVLLAQQGWIDLPGFGSAPYRWDGVIVVSTRTPTVPAVVTPTRTRIVVAVPTRRPALTATLTPPLPPAITPTLQPPPTPTPTPLPPTPTPPPPTPTPTRTPTSTPVPTPVRTQTPVFYSSASTFPALVVGDSVPLWAGPGDVYDVVGTVHKGAVLLLTGRTANGAYWQVRASDQMAWVPAHLVQQQAALGQIPVIQDLPPTPTPALPPTPILLPAPVLLEPEEGAIFGGKVRFKFSWVRRLLPHEKVSVYIGSFQANAESGWWSSEQDLLNSGGAIHAVPGGYVYEVNSGLERIPPGKASWRVAVFDDTPGAQRRVSAWSEERGIVRR